jgi:hypothetical protein
MSHWTEFKSTIALKDRSILESAIKSTGAEVVSVEETRIVVKTPGVKQASRLNAAGGQVVFVLKNDTWVVTGDSYGHETQTKQFLDTLHEQYTAGAVEQVLSEMGFFTDLVVTGTRITEVSGVKY